MSFLKFIKISLPLLHLLLLFLSLIESRPNSGDINWWCNKTPYPDPCKKYFMNNIHANSMPKNEAHFRKMVIKSAFEKTVDAEVNIKNLGNKCRNEKEKAAWIDCLNLYQTTILLLNQTFARNKKCTNFDKQTWLSTAITNLETCRTGFVEFGLEFSGYMSSHLISHITNVSQLISNSLSLFKSYEREDQVVEDFPTWVSQKDRKFVRSVTRMPNLFVAKDGSANYSTIKDALDHAATYPRRHNNERFVIHIKSGIYYENLLIGHNLNFIMLVGDGLRHTIITGSRSIMNGFTTFASATVAVTGYRFIAKGITFRNTAGPQDHQAVALRSGSDLSVFYRCGFEGYQDTLYVHSLRQFYKECYIYGTVDIIFGDATAVLQNCMIYARRPMDRQKITITAQARNRSDQTSGISIQNCRVMPTLELIPVLDSFKAYLGRPWRKYSRTVYIRTYIDSLVDLAGWLEWDGDFALDTLYYGEYHNYGPGSSTAQRVKWRGYRVITDKNEASQFSVANFIKGLFWLPLTNVPFSPNI